ncbi:MAG: hypothetical protein K9J12_04005 [Melioribacteraceae bacterium]|nr:hypothetical protein [Melioribacteraceae bacterium]MCF8264698.1 hypothetical protein [Melioribacteraceae bacterium]MCF8412238.1 hypothetical protein [Melioribacteraceae bacterium]MCF8431120.1 hypothetical protein [Melioribacteraceae bacterium]
MKNQKYNDALIVLGAIWLFTGLVIFENAALWPMGLVFFIAGWIGKYGRKK